MEDILQRRQQAGQDSLDDGGPHGLFADRAQARGDGEAGDYHQEIAHVLRIGMQEVRHLLLEVRIAQGCGDSVELVQDAADQADQTRPCHRHRVAA